MCGIAGELAFKKQSISQHWVEDVCQQMAYRGPDGSGFFCDDYIALGHRRLSIIDLSGGDQPMSYHDRYTITYNGEIYNYLELKQELSRHGMLFRTNSDTEVILAAYAFWGIDFLKRLNGIFSFGIWDSVDKVLLIARDHLGVKPLLYFHDDEGFCFASELKALMGHVRVNPEIDSDALYDYLMLGYVLSPRTIIRNISKLDAGSYLLVSNGEIKSQSYWDLAEFAQAPPLTGSDDDLAEQFDTMLRDKIQQQMVSDVPVGAFLSGGIDSSTISLYANQATSHNLRTFSAGFHEASYSELDYAELVANQLQTDHLQKVIPPQSLEKLSELIWKYDEPLGDTSLISTHFVAELAREHVTVVLSGDGGDELLAGYDTYLADKFQRYYAKLPSFVHHGIITPSVNRLSSNYKKVSWDFKLKQFVSQAYTSPERAHFGWRLMFKEDEVADFTTPNGNYHPFDTYSQHYHAVESASPINQALYVDMKTWLVDDILNKVDRATMACSLEARVPFLAWDFVEFAMRLPDHLKLRGLERKHILKKVMKHKLPDAVVSRKKRGFNTPIGIWLRNDLASQVSEIFAKGDSQMIDLQHPTIQNLWKEHVSGHTDHTFKLWTLLSLILWEKTVYQSMA